MVFIGQSFFDQDVWIYSVQKWYNDEWSADDKKNALAHLKCLDSFEFIYCMITIYRPLMYLKQAVVKIQGRSMGPVASVSIVMKCCK